MRIAINTSFLPEEFLNDYSRVLSALFRFLSAHYRQHHFIFFCQKEKAADFHTGENIDVYQTALKKSPLVTTYWYDVKIPALLRRYKADIFFHRPADVRAVQMCRNV